MNNLLGRETSGDVLDRLQIPTVLRVKSKVLSLEHMAHKVWSLRAPPISFHCLPPSPRLDHSLAGPKKLLSVST